MNNYRNIFNGYFLQYNLNKEIIKKILNIIKKSYFEIYDNDDKLVFNENYDYYGKLPIGIFSHEGFVLHCSFSKTNRILNHHIDSDITNLIVLNENQNMIIDEILKVNKEISNLNKSPIYITLVANCGIGKTIITIYLICLYKIKTFIIVNNLELTSQWYNNFIRFVKNINIISSSKGAKEFLKKNKNKNIDVLIFPDKHLENKNFIDYLNNNYSMGIIDECHLYNLENKTHMANFLLNNSFQRILSLTATPRLLNSFFLGRTIYANKIINNTEKFQKYAYKIFNKINITNNIESEYLAKYRRYVKKNYSEDKILELDIIKKRCIEHDHNRIFSITNNIVNEFLKNQNQKVLILTKFVDEIYLYFSKLSTRINPQNIFIIDANKKKLDMDSRLFTINNIKDFINKKDRYIIISTEANLGTGIDIYELNTLHITFLTNNENNIKQFLGRISRDNNSKIRYFYYYNINSYKDIKITTYIKKIDKILIENNWKLFALDI